MLSLNKEVILESLLREALDKIDYVLNTPEDKIWLSKVTDFQSSVYAYLSNGKLSDFQYPHKILTSKQENKFE